jgi:hypothetical protein
MGSVMRYLAKIEAMSRGVVVLDENITALRLLLQARNIKVIVPPVGMKDPDIIATLLPHRILITNNEKDFVSEASSFEFGIVSIPQSLMADPEKAVKAISDALTEHSLWSKRHGFLVRITYGGSTYKELKD